MRTLDGMGALVTGGSRGIGAAVARALAARGARVAVGHHTGAHEARAVVAAIEAAGGEAAALRADVGVWSEAEALVARAAERWGGLDVLVNAAGVAERGALEAIDEAAFGRQVAVNLAGVVATSRAAAAAMASDRGGRGGSIVNVSSVNGQRPVPGAGVYCATKAAVDALTVSFAHELGPRGVRVNAVAPGATDTEMLRGANTPEALGAIPGATALGRLGRPEDVARAVAFLAGPEAAWITGVVLRADGGLR